MLKIIDTRHNKVIGKYNSEDELVGLCERYNYSEKKLLLESLRRRTSIIKNPDLYGLLLVEVKDD